MTYNRGIMHLRLGNAVACRKRNAIMWTPPEKFADDPQKCKRCEAIWNKAQQKQAAKADCT